MADVPQSAATQTKMNALHEKVARVFMAVLERYETRMDLGTAMVSEAITSEQIEIDVLKELFKEDTLPSPAMMSAITKFLKDNEIMFDKGIAEELSAQQRALEEKARNRPNLANLTIVPKVG